MTHKRKASTPINEGSAEIAKQHKKRLICTNTATSTSSPNNQQADNLAAQDEQIVMVDKSCQIDTKCDEMIKLKVENHFLKKKLSKCKNLNVTIKQKHFFCVDVKNDDKQLRFYTGLTWLQVMTLEFSWTLERRTIASQELTKVRAISK